MSVSVESAIVAATRVREAAYGASRGRIVAVASGKGGVGKTWFAVTLAHAIAAIARRPRVLLVDCDFGLANVDVQLGLLPNDDLGAVAAGTVALADAVLRHPAGFDVLPGRSGSGALAAMPAALFAGLLTAVQDATAQYDAVVLDLAAGIDPQMRRLALFADQLLLMLTAEPTSLTDGYALLKLHARDRGDLAGVGVVVNQAVSAAQGNRTHAALAQACRTYLGHAPPLAGIIRSDGRVRDAIRRQTPLIAHAPLALAAADVRAIAARVVGA